MTLSNNASLYITHRYTIESKLKYVQENLEKANTVDEIRSIALNFGKRDKEVEFAFDFFKNLGGFPKNGMFGPPDNPTADSILKKTKFDCIICTNFMLCLLLANLKGKKTFEEILQLNILIGGDCCNRGMVIAAILSASDGMIPTTLLKSFETNGTKQYNLLIQIINDLYKK